MDIRRLEMSNDHEDIIMTITAMEIDAENGIARANLDPATEGHKQQHAIEEP